MRLLCAKTQTLHEFVGDAIPPYAALSHTWETDEITFQDITNGHSYRESKKGWAKVIKCCQQAVEDALEFVWIDTCCIDKSNSNELQEAINSMFKCHPGLNAEPQEKQSALQDYMRARWFTRGWTLQELLAPPSVRFFDSTWLEFGDKISLREQISEATGISQEVLVDSVIDIHRAMNSTSIAQRMSWASRRTTTKEEDMAYCLLGIFDANMPLLYGEGPKAFQRLQEEIMKRLDDQSILAWGFSLKDNTLWSVSTALARSPRDFHNCGGIASRGAAAPGDGFSISQRGLRLDLPVFGDFGNGDILYCILNCTMMTRGSKTATPRLLAVPLARCLSRTDGAKPKPDEYYRLFTHNRKPSKMKTAQDFPRLKLCDPCSRLLTEYRDEANPDPNSIRYHMWYEARGYEYCRTRRELERASVFGCVFCKAVAGRDHRYHRQQEDDSNASDDSEDETGLLFDERRPAWYPPLDEELGLSIRYQWVDNVLWIWSRSGIEWSGGDLSWAMYATPGDPAASVVHAQALLQDLESPESFAEARGWMDECLANHDECPAHLPTDLPTRLIEVSRLGDPESARLCETRGQKGHYCALSYCWGGDQVLKTLRERYDRYQKELPYDQLPQTIKDAFQVTRSMGLKYIWIDAFCIIQDSDEDKQAEMAKMMGIYQKTQFTISVASASAATQGFLQTDYHDPSIGAFYHPLRVKEDIMGSVIISEGSSSFASVSAHQQPINTRGWTLQEALLTPRLLIFTNMHMVWKCQTGYQPDFHATSRDSRERREEDSPWRFWSTLCGYLFTPLKELDELAGLETPQTGKAFNALGGTYTTWHYILNKYSTRQLTVESDRLPAISAIAQAFAAHFKTEYYAGLWGRFLVHDLMWENWLSNPNATKSGAPSWSWATMKGELHYDRGNTDYARAEVVSCKTTPVSDENPFGAVTGGELVIRGHVNKLWLIGGEPFARKLFDNKDKAIADVEFISDGGLEDWNGRRTAVLCLVLGDKPGSVMHRDYPSCCPNYVTRCPESTRCRMMVLVESLDREGCYERIGLAKAETYKKPCWWEKCEKMTVTVV
ncbi:heterokaryon incompatibility domain-containing protein [Trichoderma sp. SZMC 28014]